MKKLLTQRGYAKWRANRRLVGASPAAVQRAVKSGRITGALVDVGGKILVDPEVADELWEAGTRPRSDHPARSPRPAAADGEAMTTAELVTFLDEWLVWSLAIAALESADDPAIAADVLAARIVEEGWTGEWRLPDKGMADVRSFVRARLEPVVEALKETA
jgi:hypothetical protein